MSQPSRAVSRFLDFERGVAGLVLLGGEKLTTPIDISQLPESNRIAQVMYSTVVSVLHCRTTGGDEIVAELPTLETSAPRRGRPVVYLDQKDWRTLRNARYEPEATRSVGEREAADAVIRLVERGELILPLSSGHLLETLHWENDQKRYEFALTMLQLSRGWQLRHPLEIRISEVRAALTHRGQSSDLATRNVITLEPYAMLGTPATPYVPPPELPPQDGLASRAALSLTSVFAALLDGDHLQRVDVPGWADWQQEMSDLIVSDGLSRQAADREIDRHFVADTLYEIAHAAHATGTSLSQAVAWMEHGLDRDVPHMPSLGLFREVMRERHLNGQNRWEQNDLIDMSSLTCAVGYADHVVGERRFISYLKRSATRLRRPVSIHPNLEQLCAALSS